MSSSVRMFEALRVMQVSLKCRKNFLQSLIISTEADLGSRYTMTWHSYQHETTARRFVVIIFFFECAQEQNNARISDTKRARFLPVPRPAVWWNPVNDPLWISRVRKAWVIHPLSLQTIISTQVDINMDRFIPSPHNSMMIAVCGTHLKF